jgi:geranylgeranyl pyrophosphate synthase
LGAKGTWFEDDDISVLTEDQFHFAEVILESVPHSIQEGGKMLRPFIEQLANTAGRPTSSSFGPNGEYIHLFQ